MVARVGGEQVRASFVVACDGVHSGLRESAGIPFDGDEYPGRWAVMDAAVEGWPYGRTRSRSSSTPTASGRCRSPAGGCASSSATTRRAAPEVADAQAVIDRHAPGAPDPGGRQPRRASACTTAWRAATGRAGPPGGRRRARDDAGQRPGLNTGVQDAVTAELRRARRCASCDAASAPATSRRRRRPSRVQAAARGLLAAVLAAGAATSWHGAPTRTARSSAATPPPAGSASPPAAASPTPARSCARTALSRACATCCATPACSSGSPPASGPRRRLALAARFAPVLRARVIVTGELPAPAPRASRCSPTPPCTRTGGWAPVRGGLRRAPRRLPRLPLRAPRRRPRRRPPRAPRRAGRVGSAHRRVDPGGAPAGRRADGEVPRVRGRRAHLRHPRRGDARDRRGAAAARRSRS